MTLRKNEKLYVATAYSNPLRWISRRRLHEMYRRQMEGTPNAELWVGELAYGDRDFEVTDDDIKTHVRMRTDFELWHKENILNVIISRWPSDWKYGAWVDGDVVFTRDDWAQEAIEKLQHYSFVQLFSTFTDLGYKHRPKSTNPGFVFAEEQGWNVHGRPKEERNGRPPQYDTPGSPGLGWAFTREAFDTVGGLLDVCIMGSGDHHMAVGLAQMQLPWPDVVHGTESYRQAIFRWQRRARLLNKNIGYLDSHIIHHFHGPKGKRGYEWRWKILRDNKFDPNTDIYRDAQMIYQLTESKPQLRDDLRSYFASRNEDSLGD